MIRTTNILDDYEIKEEIAKGAYASCHRCVHKISKVEHAVKVSKVFIGLFHAIPNFISQELFDINQINFDRWLQRVVRNGTMK